MADAGCAASEGRDYDAFVEAFLANANIHYTNPEEALCAAKREAPKRKLWNFYDYHYSPAGHAMVADELYRLVLREVQAEQ